MAIDLKAILRLDDQMTGKLTRINRQLSTTQNYANKASSTFGSFGAKLAGVVGFTGLTAGLTASVKTMADFDSAMRKAGAIADASSAELSQMGETAKKLGADTSKSALEVANAMTELAAKGFNAQQVMKAMPGIIAASEASGEDLALTSDTVATALNTWKLKASESSHVADVLAMAANKTAAGITDMQYAFKYAGAPAATLGMSLEELSAAVGLITNAGIDGSTAGTSLRQGLSMLVSPSNNAQKAMDKVGFSAIDANGKVKSMAGIVTSLKDAMKGMTNGEKITFMKGVVGTESLSSFLALVDAGPAKLSKLQKALENSDGAADEASKKMKDGIGGALEQASGAIETFMINVGDKFAPTITEIANTIANMDTQPTVDAIASIGNAAKETADYILENWPLIRESIIGITSSIIAFKAAMATATIIMTVTKMMRAYKAANVGATTAQALFNGVLLANPIGLVVTAIAGLIGIIVVLVRNWDTVTKKTKQFWKAIGGGSGVIRIIMGPLGILIGAAIDLAKNWDSTKSVWENVWGAMKRSAAATVNSVIGGINEMIKVINKIPGVNIPVVAKVNWGTEDSAYSDHSSSKFGAQAIGYAGGLDNVRYDGMPARLHEGEMVLTKEKADAYRNGENGGKGVNITIQNMTVRQDSDIEAIASAIADKVHSARERGA